MKRAINFSSYFLKDISIVIRFLIISDTILIGASGFLGPIFALFVEDYIKGSNATVVGLAAAIFLITKSLSQIPVAILVDKIRGEKDDFYILFVFSILSSLAPLLYLIISTPLELYLVQFVLAILTAFTFPSYMAIFTRHIGPKKEGTAWGIYFTLTDLAAAAFGAIGGYIAFVQGFATLIIIVVVVSVIGALLLWPIKPYIREMKGEEEKAGETP